MEEYMEEKYSVLNDADFSSSVNLARYLQSIRKFPILEQEEEYRLATEYIKTKNEKIAYQLITSHLRLVVKVVSKYKGYGLPIGEMIAEGNIGLLYAVNKFDPEKGFRFSTYALWWIKASVQKYILNSPDYIETANPGENLRFMWNELGQPQKSLKYLLEQI